MNAVTLKPITGQHFKLQPEQSHPRLSLRRILYVKFLRWVDKASWRKLGSSLLTLVGASAIVTGIMVPQFMLGLLYEAATWHGYRVPIACAALVVFFFGAKVYRAFLRLRVARVRTGNQHTFHGIPVDEFCSYLLTQGQFIREHAMAALHISREKYDAIAKELEGHHILERGENNARVLTPISREQLTTQLSERKYPLVYDETRKEWALRDGSFNQWILGREKAEQRDRYKQERGIARLEKKREALQQEVGTMEQAGFICRALEIA